MRYPAIFEPEEEGISVSFPDFPCSFTCGKCFAEAMHNAQEVLSLAVEGLIFDEKKELPIPSRINEENENIYWVPIDADVVYKIMEREKNKQDIKVLKSV